MGITLLCDCDGLDCSTSLLTNGVSELCETSCVGDPHAGVHASAMNHVSCVSEPQHSTLFDWHASGCLHEHSAAVNSELSRGRSTTTVVQKVSAGRRPTLQCNAAAGPWRCRSMNTCKQFCKRNTVLCRPRLSTAPAFAFQHQHDEPSSLVRQRPSRLLEALAEQLLGESLLLANTRGHNVVSRGTIWHFMKKTSRQVAPSVFNFSLDHAQAEQLRLHLTERKLDTRTHWPRVWALELCCNAAVCYVHFLVGSTSADGSPGTNNFAVPWRGGWEIFAAQNIALL